jgi:ankyrin repeat protein
MIQAKWVRDFPVGWTPLIVAAREGQADIVESLLSTPGMDVDEATEVGDRALLLACLMGHLAVVKLLVAAGARVEAHASDNLGPLESASFGGHLEVVKYLVEEAGADVTRAIPGGGKTPIRCAVMQGHADIVKYLLGRPGSDIDAVSTRGETALTMACREGRLAVVKVLVAAGSRVEPQPREQTGPLGAASLGGHLEVVKYVVDEARADVNRAGRGGETPLRCAVSGSHTDIVEYLLGRPDIDIDARSIWGGESALILACRMGNLAVVKRLVAAGSSVEAQASNEVGPLVAAAVRGHLEVVKYLVDEAGADVTRENPAGETPIRCAARKGYADIVEYLLGRPGSDLDAVSTRGESALTLACRMNRLAVVKLLVAAGARVEAQAGEKRGPLGTAASEGHLEVVKYLVEEAGADVTRAGRGGETPITCAAKVEIVEYLRQVTSRREHEVCVPKLSHWSFPLSDISMRWLRRRLGRLRPLLHCWKRKIGRQPREQAPRRRKRRRARRWEGQPYRHKHLLCRRMNKG